MANSDWERVGTELLALSGLNSPVNMRVLVRACRLQLCPRGCRDANTLRGLDVFYCESDDDATQQQQMARGVARWALSCCDMPTHDLAIHCVTRVLLGHRGSARAAIG